MKTLTSFKIENRLIDLEMKLAHLARGQFSNDHVYSLDEAASYLKTSADTLNLYAKRKKITYSIVGKKKVFRKKDLDDFIERNSKLHSDF